MIARHSRGFWSVLFGLPSARVKGFYLIMTTMAAQWITVPLVTQSKSIGEEDSLNPGKVPEGSPWAIDNDIAGITINTLAPVCWQWQYLTIQAGV
jgi:branched-chain amino acid transport system permease protein